ncbi:ubiquitin/metalloprotease fusion protein [Histoplasma capsulatum var. duboisii H88]|uniref:Ubiquitin/metalloprotease fusion protein n=1 Tax=Ajellomyces capsulatus (strain H88) TaxID=544711 RepID=F0UMI7_AJEC8|nr:ubiquitin/metalloprotease fusion protein [Histoplasma capsulatum var. duboisii H88]
MGDFQASQATPPRDDEIALIIHHRGEDHTFSLSPTSTLQDLSASISDRLSVPPQNQKLLISPKPGMQRHPFQPTPLATLPYSLPRFKITLFGSTAAEVASINDAAPPQRPSPRSLSASHLRPARPNPRGSPTSLSQYTFHTLLPLAHLPNPSRSLAYLTRLRDDPGIRAAMKAHKFSVPLLTEMDPAEHTTVSSRTLGLNRNKGEVIELRLRTDAYDGYRDYRTIRKTLCHELAHCVFGDHDRDFWDLTAQIEREVERADYWGAGRKLTDEEFYNPADWEEMRSGALEVVDHGGWTGGEFLLGGDGGREYAGLSRREILAEAAERRAAMARREREEKGNGGEQG